jgi:hypothetical protein
MKNNLKYQLERIQRLMETKKPLSENNLNESVLGGVSVRINNISDLMKYFGIGSKEEIIEKIEKSGLKDSERVAESFDNLLETSIQGLTDDEYKFVSAIVRRLFPTVIKNFESELEKIIKSRNSVPGFFDKLITNLKTNKSTPQEFIDFMQKGYNVIISKEAILIYLDYLNKITTDIVVLPEGFYLKWKNLISKIWNKGVVGTLSDFWNFWWDEISHLRLPSVISNLRSAMRMEYTGTYEQLLEPLEVKMKSEYEMISKKIDIGKNNDFTQELNNINNLLQDYRLQKVKGAKAFFDTFLSKIKEDLQYRRFFDPQDPYYYKKWYSDNGEKDFYVKLIDGYQKSEGILPKIEITTSKLEALKRLIGGLNPLNKEQKLEFSRIWNMLLTWSPRTFEEAAINRKILGTKKWIIKGIVQKVVFTVFVLGAWYSIVRVARAFILAGVNTWLVEHGHKPYKYFEEITDEDFKQVDQSTPGWLASIQMTGNFWMNSLSFIGTDAQKVSFWSPLAPLVPKINNAIRELLNPTRNILPVLKEANDDVMRNEVKSVVNDTTSNVNGNVNVKKFTDSMGLKIMDADTLLNTADQKISEIIK